MEDGIVGSLDKLIKELGYATAGAVEAAAAAEEPGQGNSGAGHSLAHPVTPAGWHAEGPGEVKNIGNQSGWAICRRRAAMQQISKEFPSLSRYYRAILPQISWKKKRNRMK